MGILLLIVLILLLVGAFPRWDHSRNWGYAPSGLFSVQLDHNRVVLAHLAGRLRRNRIRVLAGDRVTLELSPYDLTKGRITFRHR